MRSRNVDPRHQLGRRGEKIASRFLRKNGYKILTQNYRARGGGEVDIVCQHGDAFVFVEVKTRTSLAFGRPYEAVDSTKQRLIEKGARAWMQQFKGANIYYRYDIVEVLVEQGKAPSCTIIPDAF